MIVALPLACLGGFDLFKTHQAWNKYLNRVKAQEGLILLSAKKEDGHFILSGLRDPLAADPLSLLGKEEKKRLQLKSHWQPFFSLDPNFILMRAEQLLKPPSTIELTLSGSWLFAKGRASQDWIDTFQKAGPAIAGISRISKTGIDNIDREKMDNVVKELAKVRIYFEKNSTVLIKGQDNTMAHVVEIIKIIQDLQSVLNTPVGVIILGHTDSFGSEQANHRLSRNRAEFIFNSLIVRNINPFLISLAGVGTKLSLSLETSEEDRQFNRAVTFKTFYTPLTKGN